MRRHLIIALILLSLPALTDALVSCQLAKQESVGYTVSERDGMSRLVGRTLAKRKGKWTEARQAAALNDLWEMK